MWTPEKSSEIRKCRHRVVSFCKGLGAHIGCGDEKINKNALAIGSHKDADVMLDLSANDSLSLFSSGQFDYVFSAHTLQNFFAWKAVLKEWWRVIRPGGYLILYHPDPDFCPRIGTNNADSNKLVDLYWQDVWDVLKSYGNAKRVSISRHNESNEYSWLLIVRKKSEILKKIKEILSFDKSDKPVAFPRKKKTDKEALVIRFGAIGDTTWCTPLFEKLKQDGYYVAFCTTEKGAQIVKEDPNIDEFIIHEKKGNVIEGDKENLTDYWEKIGKSFDKVINLTRTCEGKLLKIEGSPGYDWPHLKRHKECNINYQDYLMKSAGYSEEMGRIPILHFTDMEKYMGSRVKSSNKDKFLILWSLSGSAFHKVYPWAEQVAREFIKRHDDVMIITVGDEACRLLEWNEPHTVNKSGEFTVRQSMVMTKYADLVIGSETGVLNAAAAYDVPKIIFLSHSSRENLTKHWKNTDAMFALDCDCHPCHKLIYSNTCPKGNITGESPKCMENLPPSEVLDAMEKWYDIWHKKKQNLEESQGSSSQTGQARLKK